MSASLYGYTEVVDVLLGSGANINLQDKDEWSALMLASRRGHKEVVNLLLDKGAQIDLQENEEGKSAIFVACEEEHIEVVKLLLEKHPQLTYGITKEDLLYRLQVNKDLQKLSSFYLKGVLQSTQVC